MENLTEQKVYIVDFDSRPVNSNPRNMDNTIIGVFSNLQNAEECAEHTYRKFVRDKKFSWVQGKTIQEFVSPKLSPTAVPVQGYIHIKCWPVCSKYVDRLSH